MELAKIRKHRNRYKAVDIFFARNPVLAISLDLPFLIATTISLRAAVAMSLELFIVHMGTMLCALITRRYLAGWVRPMVNVTVSTLLMVVSRLWLIALFRGITDTLGMYIYLMAVNGMTVYQSSTVKRDAHPGLVMGEAFLDALGFSLAMFVVSLFREYVGNGTLWGRSVPVPLRMPGLLVPFSGFILVGFLLALTRVVNKALLGLALREQARKDARFTVVSGKG